MKSHGLFQRISHGSGHHSWASRDYGDTVTCRAASCPVNDKQGHCGSPALAKLNAEAQCETFLEFKNKPPVATVLKCRICGGRIGKEPLGNTGGLSRRKLVHLDEKMSHEAVP